MEPTTCKKIVSKGEYISNVGKKVIVSSTAMALFMLGLVGFALALVFLIILGSGSQPSHESELIITILSLCVSATLVAICGYKRFKRAAKIDPGVPLTRANTADLLAPDSLVRANSEPMQAQEAVLLRAAAQGVETPPEQLVRASVSFSASRSGRPGQE